MTSKAAKTNRTGLMASTPHSAPPGTKQVKVTQRNGLAPFGAASSLSASFEIDPVVKPPNARKATTLDLVCDAIKAVGVPRKGASYIAIKKWIIDSGNMEATKVAIFLKKAVDKGITVGLLSRPTKYKDLVGARGYFILNEKIPKKPMTKVASKKPMTKVTSKKPKVADKKRPAPTEAVSDSEMPSKKTNKPERLNLSDTMVEDIRKKEKKMPKVTKAKGTSAPKVAKPKGKTVSQPKQPSKTVSKQKTTEAGKEKSTAKPSKVKEVASKTVEKGKKPTSKAKPPPRKDLSDTELDVKRNGRKSLKSYSSDTDIDIVRENAAKKKVNDASKTVNATDAEASSKRNRKEVASVVNDQASKTEAPKSSKSHKTKKAA